MNFDLSADQQAIVCNISALMEDFDDDYWLTLDRTGDFPEAFYRKIVEAGWIGIAMPEAYGGAGLGITDAALMMSTVANTAGAMAAASAIHINMFGPHPIVVFGSDEQKKAWLPPLIAGEDRCCFGVTEPDAGLDSTNIKTVALQQGDHYVISGRKLWTSCAKRANKIIILARTTPRAECARPTDGISLFYTDLDRQYIETREIDKMGRKAVDSNMTFIDELPVPKSHLIGEEGKGFRYILHGLNPERILIAAEAIGVGRNALDRAARYARERIVFGRPIGMNQAIQHPLAINWVELEAAYLMCMRAAAAYDQGLPCGALANAAKYLAAEAGFKAATRAVMTHGGMGYAKEYHVERLMREVMIPRLAPISMELALSYVAEKVLNLPKSY
ncbi:MAG: acyl-CoA dehydrogenase [Proteobacteria bacterium]|nr:MAG: acyl-CoA dehydrogenase [Pseudomonadota bacterium]